MILICNTRAIFHMDKAEYCDQIERKTMANAIMYAD